MNMKNLSMLHISSISGEDTDKFLRGSLSHEKCMDFLIIVDSIENELLPKITDIESRINIKKYVDKIKSNNNYSKIIQLLNSKTKLSFKEKKVLGIKKQVKVPAKIKNDKNLYINLVNFCENIITNFNCTCEKSEKYKNDISACEKDYSRKCINYDCYALPFMYLLKRIDRHCSELVYALSCTEEALNQMDTFDILELGCGPAMSLIAMDYYNKKYNYNKLINYLGIDINPIWEIIHNEIKKESQENPNINTIELSKNNIVQNLNLDKKYNIVILNYVISWFAENNLNNDIDKIFLNSIESIDTNKSSIIIINDVEQDFKGVNEFIKIKKVLDKFGLKYNITKRSLNGKDTIFQKYYNYWQKNNKCTSAQMIITIGGKNDN